MSTHIGQRLRKAKLDSNDLSTSAPSKQQLAMSESESSSDNQSNNRDSTDLSDIKVSTLPLGSPASLTDWPITLHSENTIALDLSANYIDSTDLSSMSMTQYGIPSPFSQPNFPFTVFTALYINGQIQGLTCSTTYSSRTPPPTPAIPLPLHPTMTQQLIIHPRWFDRLPFPTMRDTLIKLQGVIDEEEIIRDIFTMPSWTMISGRASWDPSAWKMEKEWAGKWGWLMI